MVRRVEARVVVWSVLISTVSALPAFVTSAFAVEVERSLRSDVRDFGLIIAVFYGSAGIASILSGWRWSRRPHVLIEAGCCSAAGCVISSFSRSLPEFGVGLGIAGVGSGIMGPYVNALIAQGVSKRRQGFAFGVKQSGVPVATTVAGIVVPVLGSSLGWRNILDLEAVIVLAVAVQASRRWGDREPARSAKKMHAAAARVAPEVWTVAIVAVGMVLAGGAATALGTFAVQYGQHRGLALSAAASLVLVGGLLATASRLLAGAATDRWRLAPMTVAAGMVVVGSAGFVCLSLGLLWVGVILAYGAGSGWNGLVNYAISREFPGQEAEATGVLQFGGRLGGVVGPGGFGFLVAASSYSDAWYVAGACAVMGGTIFFSMGRLYRRDQDVAVQPSR